MSVSLRASTRVSPGFTLPRHSSPSFGSQHMCSAQTALRRSWPVGGAHVSPDTFIPHTRCFARILAHVYGLLGPCFKTGRMRPCTPKHRCNGHRMASLQLQRCAGTPAGSVRSPDDAGIAYRTQLTAQLPPRGDIGMQSVARHVCAVNHIGSNGQMQGST